MLYCEVVLLSALSLALGHLPSSPSELSDDELLSLETFNTPSPQPTSYSLQDVEETDVDEVMGSCVFGRFPTATCMVKCFWKNMSAYCDEDANCRCGTDNEEDDVEGSYRAPQEESTILHPDLALVPYLDDEEGVMGVCFFGHIPSPSCMFRCSVRGQSTVCDEESRCICEDRTWRDLLTPSPTQSEEIFPETEQGLAKNESESGNEGSAVFFIFDLSRLFEPEDVVQKEDTVNSSCSTCELWTVPHMAAMAILTLMSVLVILELVLCCKRNYCRTCKEKLQTVLSCEAPEKEIIK